jgi:hypothetical protein
MEELDILMCQYLALNEQLSTLEKIKKELKAQIEVILVTNNITTHIDTLGNKLTYKEISRMLWDKEKISKIVDDPDTLKTESVCTTLRIDKAK